MTSIASLTVLVAGASSAAGVAAASALHDAGATVLVSGTDEGRLRTRLPFAAGHYAADLADPASVAQLAERVHGDHGRLDGLVHLVGGWRGGRGLAGQSDEDYDFLHRSVLTTLRNTTRAFYEDIAASPCGRMGIVSATAVDSPTASGANYTTVKAAAEAWMRAAAAGLKASQSGRQASPEPQRSAAAVWVIKAFVDDASRAADPAKGFEGFTDVADFGSAVVRLFEADAADVNGTRIPLLPAS